MAYRPEVATPNPANHVKGFPESYFERLEIALGLVKPRCHALDLGTGRGEVARGLARQGATVTAIDSDVALLEAAREGAGDSALLGALSAWDPMRGSHTGFIVYEHTLPMVCDVSCDVRVCVFAVCLPTPAAIG